MKKKEWNEGLNHIDPDLVEKYVEQKDRLRQKNKKPKSVWLRFGAIAACFLLIVSAVIVVPMLRDDDIINKIYEVDHKQYNEEKEFNHKHLISGTPEILFDKNVQLEKNFIINGMEQKLKYNRTLRYDIGNECLLEYFVDGDEEKVILLSDDGKIDSILYDYTVLEISKTTNSDEVLELLKNELRKFVDISFYSNVTVDETEYLSGTNYDYLFFNNENGYMTDFLRASVDVDGNVYAVKINNLKATDHLKVDVDKEKEQQAIELKLKDIYNTEITQYKSYEEVFDPRIVIYEDQLYVEYFVAATYTHEQHGERSSYINTLLIPLEMINN